MGERVRPREMARMLLLVHPQEEDFQLGGLEDRRPEKSRHHRLKPTTAA